MKKNRIISILRMQHYQGLTGDKNLLLITRMS
jgi:hypothetical protein